MPSANTHSNIRAFVRWKEQNVYAGEGIECLITFKNMVRQNGNEDAGDDAQTRGIPNGILKDNKRATYTPSAGQSRRSSITQSKKNPSRAPSVSSARGWPLPNNKGHRPTLSVNVVSAPARIDEQNNTPGNAAKTPGGHGRSVSIISMGSEPANDGRTPTGPASGKRTFRTHTRSASLQYVPGRQSPRQPSPLYESATPPALADVSSQPLPIRPARQRQGTASAGTTPQLRRQMSEQSKPGKDAYATTFKFPPSQPSEKASPMPGEVSKPTRTPSTMHSNQKQTHTPRSPDIGSGAASNMNPISRVLSESSVNGTPRTSSEFYSQSNHSNETMMSEIPTSYRPGRFSHKQSPPQRTSPSPPQFRSSEPETLMMAYAQTMGHFTLDGSLVNLAPFEEVKRKGVQGGGGVVGVERSKRSSGMFGAFSWGNIGESLSGLLGGDELSSMAQMKASAGSKSIPLLSTPQNLLFIDLRLAPGESRTYSYRFSLPRGLPPSYRGRAIKISYHLDIGVQRPGGQAVSHVEVPFRVLGSYDARGNSLGHDLMSPYILLQDAATSTSLTPDLSSSGIFPPFPAKLEEKGSKSRGHDLEDFLRYTERLLNARKDSSGMILSPITPSTPAVSFQQSGLDQMPSTIKEMIDVAILRSNQSKGSRKAGQEGTQSANRFNIARSGQPVAVLTILRPAYKLGEAVTGRIDFTTSPLSSGDNPSPAATYAVSITLESSEHVDPSLALRSSTSINRVTKKVHASIRENTLYARQMSFSLSIPSTAAPSFETTGVSVKWRIRIEFTTQRQIQGLGIDGQPSEANDDLLEELASDERGTSYVAKERLNADSFEISVPLRIYGAAGVENVHSESEALIV